MTNSGSAPLAKELTQYQRQETHEGQTYVLRCFYHDSPRERFEVVVSCGQETGIVDVGAENRGELAQVIENAIASFHLSRQLRAEHDVLRFPLE